MVISVTVQLGKDQTLLYTPDAAAAQVIAALGGNPTTDYCTCLVVAALDPGEAGKPPDPIPPPEVPAGMSDPWYTHGYPGGPMVGPPLARPLYPPDSAPEREPSVDGQDIVAIKRAISRGGRWPWGNFDRAYSNAFSHGRAGGNVGDSGIAGFQRQQKIEPTGFVGEKTMNAIRSARVPEGLPHAGEPLLDATAVDLLEDYEPPSPSGKQPRQLALDHLAARDGYTESPSGSNCDSRSDGIRTSQDRTAGGGTWLRGEPWCGCWCYYALEAAGVAKLDSSLCSVSQIEDNARAARICFSGWTTDRAKVKPGDLVIVGGYGVHVETVRGFNGSLTLTYGGNTSPGSSGSQSNGGGAYERSRGASEVRGYALVRYPGE